MITEEEARKKWCPFARDSLLEECRDGVTSYSFNRAVGCGTGKLPENCLCIASDCMAWIPEMVIDQESGGTGPGFHASVKPNGEGDCGLKRGKP